MGFSLVFDEFSLLESFKIVFVDLFDFALLDWEKKLLVFIDVGLLGFKDEVFLENDDFLFHGITKPNLESRANLFFNIILGGTFRCGEVEDFGLRSTFGGIELTLFGEYSFRGFLILKGDVIESIETDKFWVKGFMGDVELFK